MMESGVRGGPESLNTIRRLKLIFPRVGEGGGNIVDL